MSSCLWWSIPSTSCLNGISIILCSLWASANPLFFFQVKSHNLFGLFLSAFLWLQVKIVSPFWAQKKFNEFIFCVHLKLQPSCCCHMPHVISFWWFQWDNICSMQWVAPELPNAFTSCFTSQSLLRIPFYCPMKSMIVSHSYSPFSWLPYSIGSTCFFDRTFLCIVSHVCNWNGLYWSFPPLFDNYWPFFFCFLSL